MNVWHFLSEKLAASVDVILLYVLDSEGSSPGRQGFKMAVAADGSFSGTIGGGIMEYKLVEKARQMLAVGEQKVLLVRQYHDKKNSRNQSGMICSGSQLNVFIPLASSGKYGVTHLGDVIEKIVQGEPIAIRLSPEGIALQETVHPEKQHSLQFRSQEDWLYIEKINRRPVIHIIGGGHVSLAFSELMSHLGFYCKVYDDRPALNTLVQNSFANEKVIIPGYEQLGEYIGEGTDELAVIMTIGYRTDKLALKQLLDKGFFYLGMLGSEKKVETIFSELRSEGVQEELLKKVFAPVGIFINSKTPREIAVSIAAEIIRERNR